MSNDLLSKLVVSLIRHDGSMWACGQDADRGIVVVIAKADAPQFRDAPPEAFAVFDLTRALGARPAAEAKVSVASHLEGGNEITAIGGLPVQLRFVQLIQALHKGCRWFAPSSITAGPIHAVLGDRTVAAIMGWAGDEYTRAKARSAGRLPRAGSGS